MATELTCPSCQARLLLMAEAGDQSLISPRCLHPVPTPFDARPGRPPAAGTTAITAHPRRRSAAPPVAAEVNRSTWSGYLVIVGVTILMTFGVAVVGAAPRGGPGDWVLWALFVMVLILTGLSLYPLARLFRTALVPPPGASAGNKSLRSVLVVVLLLCIAPAAFAAVFIAVCTGTIVVFSVAGH
jgi:hypothetical protein